MAKPTSDYCSPKAERITLFAIVVIALMFAILTNNVWEDYYITYKHSKNFVLGLGLQFDPAERVHGFTSPLGTLFPALFAWISQFVSGTGTISDDIALWLFRLLSVCFLGVTGILLLRICRLLGVRKEFAYFAVIFFAFDSKSVAFAVNGMETALLEFFVVLSLHQLISPKRSASMLGTAWAGLMWTRPDGCIYIAAMGLAFLAFAIPTARIALARRVALASLVCAALYAPWVAFAWMYYGSPVPHTIIAKGSQLADGFFLYKLLNLPLKLLPGVPQYEYIGQEVLENLHLVLFAPAYLLRRMPAAFSVVMFGLVLSYFAFAKRRAETDAVDRASKAVLLTASLVGLYLYMIPRLYPWYLPGCAVIFMIGLPLAFQWLEQHWNRKVVLGLLGAAAVMQFAIFAMSLQHFAFRQRVVDDGNRKQIGLWLKDYAKPNSTVFLECLGYVGYFSELRMLDFPGLVSPAVVAARKTAGPEMGHVVNALRPDYLVLRPAEKRLIDQLFPDLIAQQYRLVRTFNIQAELQADTVAPWTDNFGYDSRFGVFQRNDVQPKAATAAPQ